MRAARAGLAALLVILALSACQATVRVTVQAKPSGAGTVTVALIMDRQAAAQVGVNRQLQVADLARQGWALQPPVIAADGTVTQSLVHPFANPAAGQALLDELKPLDLKFDHAHGLISTRVGVSGTIDLSGGVDAFSDSALATSLGVKSLSDALTQLRHNGAALPTLGAQVVADLPARPGGLKGDPTVKGDQATWSVDLGQRLAIGASSSAPDRRAEILSAAALVLVLVAAGLVIDGVRRRR